MLTLWSLLWDGATNSSATKSLADVHKDLRQLMTPQTVLVGHSVDSDLKALKLVHKYIIDTSACYPHPKYALQPWRLLRVRILMRL